MYLRVLRVLALGPMCTGDFLYVWGEQLPPGAASGEQQQRSERIALRFQRMPR